MAQSNRGKWLVGAGVLLVIGYIVYLRSEVTSLREQAVPVNQAPAAAAQPAAADPAPAEVPGGRTLLTAQREVMIEVLGGRGATQEHPVWFATVPGDREAAALQRALASVFEEAGWQVRGNTPVRFRMKPGVFMFAADLEPPPYVSQAHEALEAGGITIAATGHGYRDFYDEKKAADPSWVGLEMGADKTYVIVVGRKPPDDIASSD